MKRFLRPIFLCVMLQSLAGCAFMGSDDREFFGKGWVNPKELDEQPSTRIPRPDQHGAAAATGTAAAGDASLPPADRGNWNLPDDGQAPGYRPY